MDTRRNNRAGTGTKPCSCANRTVPGRHARSTAQPHPSIAGPATGTSVQSRIPAVAGRHTRTFVAPPSSGLTADAPWPHVRNGPRTFGSAGLAWARSSGDGAWTSTTPAWTHLVDVPRVHVRGNAVLESAHTGWRGLHGGTVRGPVGTGSARETTVQTSAPVPVAHYIRSGRRLSTTTTHRRSHRGGSGAAGSQVAASGSRSRIQLSPRGSALHQHHVWRTVFASACYLAFFSTWAGLWCLRASSPPHAGTVAATTSAATALATWAYVRTTRSRSPLQQHSVWGSVRTTAYVVAFVVAGARLLPRTHLPVPSAYAVAVCAATCTGLLGAASWSRVRASTGWSALQQHSVWRSVYTSACLLAFIVAWSHLWAFRSPGSAYAAVLLTGTACAVKVAARIRHQSVPEQQVPVRARTFRSIHGGTFTVADTETAPLNRTVLPTTKPVHSSGTYSGTPETGKRGWFNVGVGEQTPVAYRSAVRALKVSNMEVSEIDDKPTRLGNAPDRIGGQYHGTTFTRTNHRRTGQRSAISIRE